MKKKGLVIEVYPVFKDILRKSLFSLVFILFFCFVCGGLLASWCGLESLLWWLFVMIFYVETFLVLGVILG